MIGGREGEAVRKWVKREGEAVGKEVGRGKNYDCSSVKLSSISAYAHCYLSADCSVGTGVGGMNF